MSELTPGDPSKRKAIPRFHVQSVHQPFLSEKEGRPIYHDQEFVEILIPGDRNSKVVEKVTQEHQDRWPEAYLAFRRGQDMPRHGTPLRNWPNSQMTPARIEELAFFHIVTVEELAGVDDSKLQNLGMGAREMRKAAQTYLDMSNNVTAPLERILARSEELTRENVRLQLQNDDLAAEVRRLTDQLRERPRDAVA